ncbi:MAG: hypothetical protein KBF88_13215 [Polyangiaceae bacterium]|nr:hypothetical protein [Polyangiaceae bacterium]
MRSSTITTGLSKGTLSGLWLAFVAAFALLTFAFGAFSPRATHPASSLQGSFVPALSLLALVQGDEPAPSVERASIEATQPVISPTGIQVEGLREPREGPARAGALPAVGGTTVARSFERLFQSMDATVLGAMRRMSPSRARAFLMVFLN